MAAKEKAKISEGENDVAGFGKIHCAECEVPIAYFLPDGIDVDKPLEVYCFGCATKVNTDAGANG